MLVLTRKTGQRIMIGEGIEVAVLSTSGDKVRLGIEAPTEIPVHRQEVYDAIQRGRRAGFHDFVAKFDRAGLIAALKEQTDELHAAA